MWGRGQHQRSLAWTGAMTMTQEHCDSVIHHHSTDQVPKWLQRDVQKHHGQFSRFCLGRLRLQHSNYLTANSTLDLLFAILESSSILHRTRIQHYVSQSSNSVIKDATPECLATPSILHLRKHTRKKRSQHRRLSQDRQVPRRQARRKQGQRGRHAQYPRVKYEGWARVSTLL